MTTIPYQERAEPTGEHRAVADENGSGETARIQRLWKITRIYADGRTAGRTEWRDEKEGT